MPRRPPAQATGRLTAALALVVALLAAVAASASALVIELPNGEPLGVHPLAGGPILPNRTVAAPQIGATATADLR